MLIKRFSKSYDHNSTVFLDIGANLGIHSLYAASLGFKVWAVEPQEINLAKVCYKLFAVFDNLKKLVRTSSKLLI